MLAASHPILSCDEAARFEAAIFAGDEAREWSAMQRAGRATAAAIADDFREIGGLPPDARVLVLAGKGHNAGDALIAAQALATATPARTIAVAFLLGENALRPLARRAWLDLTHAVPAPRLQRVTAPAHLAPAAPAHEDTPAAPSPPLPVAASASEWPPTTVPSGYDLVIDGVFGFQFRPPLPPAVAAWFDAVNAAPIRLRAAVDLPSGLDAPSAFRADFTYATGIVKTPALTTSNAGRVRYLDLGFFDAPTAAPTSSTTPSARTGRDQVLTPAVLAPLRALRSPHSDKRTYGHLLLLGGSLRYPGAILMSAHAALRSGAGLVTAFVPQTLAAAYAARLPEVMWVGWPETPDGALALEGLHLLLERAPRATALLIGPGLSRDPEALALVADILKTAPSLPVVLDADALQPALVTAAGARAILTPHAGEFARIAQRPEADLLAFARTTGAITVLKGPITRISDGEHVYHSLAGGPVLARGGSGDLLAGLIGGLLAHTPTDRLGAACRGVAWHGRAADLLAQTHGQVAVETTQLLDFLAPALR